MEQALKNEQRKNKMLLLDVFLLDDLQVIEESKSKGTMKVRGTFQRAEEANSNNRVYPKAVLENQINKLQPLITERRLCGELDHPQSDTVRLSNASHLVTKLWMESNEVYGEAEVLNTPAGKVAQALISDGVKIGISSRGLGTLSEGIYGKSKTVNDDFRLVTFDLVADPSTRGAYPALSESVMYTDDKYKRTLDQAISEKIFITMLKNRLNEDKKKDEPKAVSQASEFHQFDKPHVKAKRGASSKRKKASSRAARRTQKHIPIPGDLGPNFHTKDHGIQDSNDVLVSLFRDRLDEFTGRRRQQRMLARRKLAATIQKRLEYERTLPDSDEPDSDEEEKKKKKKVAESASKKGKPYVAKYPKDTEDPYEELARIKKDKREGPGEGPPHPGYSVKNALIRMRDRRRNKK